MVPEPDSQEVGHFEAWLAGYGRHQFYTKTWHATHPKAVILFVHGFADHISRYSDVFNRLSVKGITVFGYDLRGFGRTALDEEHRSAGTFYGKTSREAELHDVEHWVNYLSQKYPAIPRFLMGYSAVSCLVNMWQLSFQLTCRLLSFLGWWTGVIVWHAISGATQSRDSFEAIRCNCRIPSGTSHLSGREVQTDCWHLSQQDHTQCYSPCANA